MKVCIVAMTGLYPVDIGGPAPVAYFITKELNRNGMDVYIFIRADEEKFRILKESSEIKKLGRTKLIPINVKYEFKTFLNPFYMINKIREANEKFKKILDKCEIVLYNSPPVDITLYFPLIAKTKQKKQIFIVHGGLFYEGKNVIGKLLIRLQKNSFDKIIPVSTFSRDIALEFGFYADKIKIIPNGVDLELFNSLEPLDLEGSPKILYIGRLSRIKKVETLLYAFSHVSKVFPNAHLYIVGTGPEKRNLKKLAEKLDITGKVHFEGFIPQAMEVYKYYKSCDLFVMTSQKENFPMTLLEAMASKIPIISTDIEGGPRELIKHEKNGFLFRVGDHEALAEQMIKILENKALAKKFTLKNYELIKNKYTWKKIGSKYLQNLD